MTVSAISYSPNPPTVSGSTVTVVTQVTASSAADQIDTFLNNVSPFNQFAFAAYQALVGTAPNFTVTTVFSNVPAGTYSARSNDTAGNAFGAGTDPIVVSSAAPSLVATFTPALNAPISPATNSSLDNDVTYTLNIKDNQGANISGATFAVSVPLPALAATSASGNTSIPVFASANQAGATITVSKSGFANLVLTLDVLDVPVSGGGGGTIGSGTTPGSTVTGVTISPSSTNMQTGATLQFAATVQGANSPSQSVTWSAPVGGSVNAGLFSAPAIAGSYTVLATSTQDPNFFAQATVNVLEATNQKPLNELLVSGEFGGLVGTTELIVVLVRDIDGLPASGVTVTAVSSDQSVATFISGITGLNGEVTISAQYVGAGFCQVNLLASRAGSAINRSFNFFANPVILSSSIVSIEQADTNPKHEEEIFPYVFDFAPLLADDETILSIQKVSCKSSPNSYDPDSSAMLLGGAQIIGKKVIQFIGSGKKNATYIISVTAKATRSTATAEIRLRLFATRGRRV